MAMLTHESLCTVCGASVRRASGRACERCLTVFHSECWEFNRGCAVFGCEQRVAEDVEGKGRPFTKVRMFFVAAAAVAAGACWMVVSAPEPVAPKPVSVPPLAVASRPRVPPVARPGGPVPFVLATPRPIPRAPVRGSSWTSPDGRWEVRPTGAPFDEGRPGLDLHDAATGTRLGRLEKTPVGPGTPNCAARIEPHGWSHDSERFLYTRWTETSSKRPPVGELRECKPGGISWPVLDTRVQQSLRRIGFDPRALAVAGGASYLDKHIVVGALVRRDATDEEHLDKWHVNTAAGTAFIAPRDVRPIPAVDSPRRGSR